MQDSSAKIYCYAKVSSQAARLSEVQHLFRRKCDHPSIMCGRYVSPDEASIEREFTLVRTEWPFPPNYNVAPYAECPCDSESNQIRGV